MSAIPKSLHVAIVGSGPAGFYAAGQLLASDRAEFSVDLFDRLVTPWGLVRAGVAPDHPKIKSVTRVFEKTARNERFRFHGNVEIGTDVTHDELASAYDAVLYAVGAPTDRKLGIPGEELAGSHTATEFVAWYNGHPDYAQASFDLSAKRAVVVGNGNVALDVARMLVLTREELAVTDTADHAIDALAASGVEEVIVLGRRGPAQAAYTNPELRELVDTHADVIVDLEDTRLDPHSAAFLDSDLADVTSRRNVEIVTSYANTPPAGKPKRIVLRFLTSPVEIVGDGRVEGVRVVRNVLDADMRAKPTGDEELIEAGLVFRSIGYRGTPIPGVPFDDHGATIHNHGGRVTNPDTGEHIPGVYTAGWIKRGPSGVIGTNKKCAQDTVDLLLHDADAGLLPHPTQSPDELLDAVIARGAQLVDYAGWERLDAHERALGEAQGRPRVKIVSRAEQLQHALGARR